MSTAPQATVEEREPALAGFQAAVASDLDLIASLHDRPLTTEAVVAARAFPFADQLALTLASPAGSGACAALDAALSALPETIGLDVVDELASEHADIYYRFVYRASPTESVWRTEDGLVLQEPTFQVQQWYRRHGLRSEDPDGRPDDHIVMQLGFVAHMMEQARTVDDLVAVARFLDEHPLTWVGQLADRLSERGAPPFYTGLAALTAAYLEELREHLAEITGHARPVPVPEEAKPALARREKTCADPDDKPYVPGLAPSW